MPGGNGEPRDELVPEVEEDKAGASVMTRRALLVGAAGGLAAVTAGAAAAKVLGGGHGEHNSEHSHGNRSEDNNGNGGGSWLANNHDPNDGITTLNSEIKLPAQFKSALPIPRPLRPTRQSADTDYYAIVQSRTMLEIVPGLRTPIWGYNGGFPGPTIVQKGNRRIVVSHRNNLPVPTVVHLHGGTTPQNSDGYPTDYVLPANSYGSFPGMPAMPGMATTIDRDAVVTRRVRHYAYPPQPRAATLWYHDHRMDFTGPSVYRGLAGFHIATDAHEDKLPLPRAAHDVPLMIADRAFAQDGSFLYPSLDPSLRSTPGVKKEAVNGVMGDVILVNGAPWPLLKVDTARYRFRILNASNARTYQLALEDASQNVRFVQIGTDHGLLAAPFDLPNIPISPAQRFDVIVDFSRHKLGDEITLVNQLGSGSTALVMRFVVARETNDHSSVPAKLSEIEKITPTASMRRRTFKFSRHADEWLINGLVFDPSVSQANVKQGTTELWTINSSFHHPFHIHNATMQVVSRDGHAPGTHDKGWKDTVFVNQGENVDLAIRFNGFLGRYVFHCHNLEHEDMGMMANFHVS